MVGEQVVLELSEAFVVLVAPPAVPGHRPVDERELGEEGQAELVVRRITHAQPLDHILGQEVGVDLEQDGGAEGLGGGHGDVEVDRGLAEVLGLDIDVATEGDTEDVLRDLARDLGEDVVDRIHVHGLDQDKVPEEHVGAGEDGTVLEDDLERDGQHERAPDKGTNEPL